MVLRFAQNHKNNKDFFPYFELLNRTGYSTLKLLTESQQTTQSVFRNKG